jgi:hypothetical protein
MVVFKKKTFHPKASFFRYELRYLGKKIILLLKEGRIIYLLPCSGLFETTSLSAQKYENRFNKNYYNINICPSIKLLKLENMLYKSVRLL